MFAVAGHADALAREIAHEAMADLWGPSEPWISEGFAAYVARQADDASLYAASSAGGLARRERAGEAGVWEGVGEWQASLR